MNFYCGQEQTEKEGREEGEGVNEFESVSVSCINLFSLIVQEIVGKLRGLSDNVQISWLPSC